MSYEQQSLLHGALLAQHVDLLEQMVAHKLEALRAMPEARTPEQRSYELQLLHELGLLAGELRSLDGEPAVPF